MEFHPALSIRECLLTNPWAIYFMETITLRQAEVLAHIKECGVVGSGFNGSVLESLRKKGLVIKHFNAGGGAAVYYTWTLSNDGKSLLAQTVRII